MNETGSTGTITSHTTPTVTFTVIVIDPCTETVITPPTIASPSMNLKVDTDATFDFLEAVDSLETSQAILGLCGPRVYVVKLNDGLTNANWMSVAARSGTVGTYTVKAQPRDEALIGT